MKTISEIALEIDKMSWLRLKQDNQVMSLLGWDDKGNLSINWSIKDNNWPIINWVQLFDDDYIFQHFRQFEDNLRPIPFAQRQWSLWKPKNIWFVRLSTADAVNFILNSYDLWWCLLNELARFRVENRIFLELSSKYWKQENFVLLDTEKHKKKLEKIIQSN